MNSIASAGTLHSAVVQGPDHQELRGNFMFWFYATLINDAEIIAKNCSIRLPAELPAALTYWTTSPTDNSVIGIQNEPTDLMPKMSQSFAMRITFYSKPPRNSVVFYPEFACDNLASAIEVDGVNNINLSAYTFTMLDRLSQAARNKLRKINELPVVLPRVEFFGGAGKR